MNKMGQTILPRSGAARESLRQKGQFWTPDWVADFMAAYVLKDKPRSLLDPAVGEGAFFAAAKRYAERKAITLELIGRDVDPTVIEKAKQRGLSDNDLRSVEIRDFILDPPSSQFQAIIANPPYIRHHRIPIERKKQLQAFAQRTTGKKIDERAGLHVYFLIRALKSLAPGGRLAYIVSADICEGIFSDALWNWVCSQFRLDAVITFTSDAAPFPDVDTNALVFFIGNEKPIAEFDWLKCHDRDDNGLLAYAEGKTRKQYPGISLVRRNLQEALRSGLSRPPREASSNEFTLGDFASVMRGVVTGDNEFFFMTRARSKELGIPDSLLMNAVGRMRDVNGDNFDDGDLSRLEAAGRPTRVLNVNGKIRDDLPEPVRKYLEEGEKKGLPNKTLIKTRNPWYRMEKRKSPPIMFAYLGRRKARFIRNKTDAVPLTCLLCVYPKDHSEDFIARLWRVLTNPETIENLRKVGKSYGGDAIKVEPRSLEKLPLPESLVIEEGLDSYIKSKQASLF